jgi:hypothetical protein
MSGVSGGTLLVAESEGKAVGMAACVVFPFYANMEHARSGRNCSGSASLIFAMGIGGEILDELEAAAKRKGAKVFISANLSGEHDAAFERLYRRRGYTPAENTHIRILSS